MIQIKDIVKKYLSGENEVTALKSVSLNFRNSEFVSILGPSGCGKTTMLNIIGGLDHYTEGDLVIDGVSTKEYKDKDWDAYRNHSIGFVFQSYNLIPHQTVLQNVEIALTIAGVSKSERRQRAINALNEVGLSDQIHKKPNTLSGGQMQRVAIARALVNNPQIILADEPTGALDSETSVQVMEILKKISEDRLVIMVTHNPELAEKYSTRIINMLDGKIIGDSKPYSELAYTRSQNKELKQEKSTKKEKKPTMSFWTAFKLSLKNLFTKKARTTLTSFAGSIGIIGIALILAVSQGTTGYINYVQQNTLASYPITLEATTLDVSSLIKGFMGMGQSENEHDKDAIYKDPVLYELVNAFSTIESNNNDLASFKTYIESEMEKDNSSLDGAISAVQYTYDMELPIYTKNDTDNKVIKSDTEQLLNKLVGEFMMNIATKGGASGSGDSSSSFSNPMMSSMMSVKLWQEMLPGKDNQVINDMIKNNYEMVDENGRWPTQYNEIVLVVNENNEIDDLSLYALGLLTQEQIDAIIDAASNGESMTSDNQSWTYDEIKAREFKCILPADTFIDYDNDGIYTDVSGIDTFLTTLYEDQSKTIDLKITGIVRPKADADAELLSTGIGYTTLLTQYVINKSNESDVVVAQKANPMVDVLTGLPFKSNTGILSNEEKATEFETYVENQSEKEQAETFIAIKCLMTDEELATKTQEIFAPMQGNRVLQQNMVVQALATQMEVEASTLEAYFNELSDEQIDTLAKGVCQGMAQAQHIMTIKAMYPIKQGESAGYTYNELAGMLDEVMLDASPEDKARYYDNVTEFSENTYEEILVKIGCLDLGSPESISIFVSTFEEKDVIINAINDYNSTVPEEKKISYVDYMGIMMSSITTIIDAITYVLIAFVAISLIVSSIMIGVITLISVQERTKEIGILRAIGASKKDVSSMFNAETLIIGFTSGLLGILVTYVLCIPINIILNLLTGIANLKAVLPIPAAIILILISMSLTLVSGIIPSRSAAKKDPVEALRTE